MPVRATAAPAGVRLMSTAGRWTVAAAVLGSGTVFLESTVVSVALPAIGRDFGLGMGGLQWVLNGYLLTLSALMLLGGSLGDVHSRRAVFAAGLLGFAVMSVLSALAPTIELLVGARLLQGAAGALLVPNSLALIETTIDEADRGAAIGHWAGWSAVSTAAGPLAGGWLVDALSWRWVFAGAVPFAIAAAWIAIRHLPDVHHRSSTRRAVDYRGAALVTLGLAGVVAALVVGPEVGFAHPWVWTAAAGGAGLLGAFLLLERRTAEPLLPLSLFRSRQFTGSNLTTLLVYTALGGVMFMLMLQLQNVLGYSALAAGAALLPVNVLMLALSAPAGRFGQRFGPRWPMTLGALLAALGMALLTGVQPGVTYVASILPALGVFGLGLATLVAPLTAAVLGAVPDAQAGIASAVNNAVARLAGLLAAAALPLAAGLGGLDTVGGAVFAAGYARAMMIGAGLCIAGAVVAFVTVRGGAAVPVTVHPSPQHGCAR